MTMIPSGNSGMAGQPPNDTQGMTESYGGHAISVTAETNQAGLAAQAEAQVQARYVMAMKRPRSWDNVRVRVLGECHRPSFAASARYRKPIGQGIEGPSIRFAEACMRYAGNMSCDSMPVYEDRSKRVLMLTATDYETNASFSATITVQKTVERKSAKGRVVLSQRPNSYGDTVYIVEATEDELLNTQNALVSKAARTLILRLIPGDVIEEGQQACIATMQRQDGKDPAGARKAVCDAYAALGVMPTDLVAYIGHPLESLSPAELSELRTIYATIRDGETSWAATMEERRGDKPEKTSAASQVASLADKVKARSKKGEPAHDADGVLPHTPAATAAPAPVAAPAPARKAPDASKGEVDESELPPIKPTREPGEEG